MSRLTLLASVALLTGLSVTALAQERVRVTGLYSNMRFGTEDVSGVEIFVVYGQDAHWAVVQCADGVPGKPLVSKATVNKNVIEFEVPLDQDTLCPSGIFRGTVSAKGLRGKFERMNSPQVLARKKSYWQ
jgi:hypothetical protein